MYRAEAEVEREKRVRAERKVDIEREKRYRVERQIELTRINSPFEQVRSLKE